MAIVKPWVALAENGMGMVFQRPQTELDLAAPWYAMETFTRRILRSKKGRS
jgi:hypothetical protein